VQITKDDFAEYNKTRRLLGQRKAQRQEYHVVTIKATREEYTEEAARIMAERREQEPSQPQGGTHASPGEHSVRGHWAVSKLGKRFWKNPHRRGSGPCRSLKVGYQHPRQPRLILSAEDLDLLERAAD
jgi:hypothetical protein